MQYLITGAFVQIIQITVAILFIKPKWLFIAASVMFVVVGVIWWSNIFPEPIQAYNGSLWLIAIAIFKNKYNEPTAIDNHSSGL
jgi:hypothetical protein